MFRRRILACAVVGCAMLATALAAHADTVILRNGDRLSGKLLHKSGDVLTLKTDYAGTVGIRWSAIAAISTDAPVTLMLEGGDEITRAMISSDGAGPPLERIVYINPRPEESGRGVSYKGRVSLAATATRGNSSTQRLYGEAAFKARAKAYRYAMTGKIENASDSGDSTASNWRLTGNYDHFIDGDQFAYGRVSLEHDRFKDIELRSTVGGGYGVQFIDTDSTQLSLRGGLELVSLDRSAGSDERYPALGWGLQFSHWLWDHTMEAFHDQDGYLDLEHTGQVSLRTKTGLRIPLSSGMTANVQANVDWESDPAPGRKATDSTWLLGLGYEW